MPLVHPCSHQRLVVLRLLKIILQETTFHQLIQLVCQGQAITYVVVTCLVELTQSVLVGPHLPISLCWYLRSCRYVRDSDQLLELHSKIMLWRWVPSCTSPGLGPFVGFSRPLLFCGRLVHPHRLRSCSRSRSDRIDETLFLRYSIICDDLC